jgi:hypothetical protein
MSLEFISGLVVVLLGLIAGAFGLAMLAGPARRKPKPNSSAPKRTPLLPSPRQNAGDATKGASDVQQTVSHMPDDDVDRELRENLPAPVVVDTACNWVRIIYLTDHDIDVLDKQTKRDILAHNKSVQANCPQSTDRVTR